MAVPPHDERRPPHCGVISATGRRHRPGSTLDLRNPGCVISRTDGRSHRLPRRASSTSRPRLSPLVTRRGDPGLERRPVRSKHLVVRKADRSRLFTQGTQLRAGWPNRSSGGPGPTGHSSAKATDAPQKAGTPRLTSRGRASMRRWPCTTPTSTTPAGAADVHRQSHPRRRGAQRAGRKPQTTLGGEIPLHGGSSTDHPRPYRPRQRRYRPAKPSAQTGLTRATTRSMATARSPTYVDPRLMGGRRAHTRPTPSPAGSWTVAPARDAPSPPASCGRDRIGPPGGSIRNAIATANPRTCGGEPNARHLVQHIECAPKTSTPCSFRAARSVAHGRTRQLSAPSASPSGRDEHRLGEGAGLYRNDRCSRAGLVPGWLRCRRAGTALWGSRHGWPDQPQRRRLRSVRAKPP